MRVVAAGTGSAEPDYAVIRAALLRAVGRVCPPWLADQREDIVQVAMTKVVRLVEGGKSADDLRSGYLARLAYHAVVDEIRRQRRRRAMTVVDDQIGAEAAETSPGPEERTEGRRLGREIVDCLQRMARSRRLAVGLYLEGRGATEIAQMMQWKRKQADNLVFRGVGDLRRCLADKGLKP